MTASAKHKVEFVPSGRGKARCKADPAYPEGKVVTLAWPPKRCTVELPYPAPECGYYQVDCEECGLSVAVTSVGRADDPRAVVLPCLNQDSK